jgi:hypothetical protein
VCIALQALLVLSIPMLADGFLQNPTARVPCRSLLPSQILLDTRIVDLQTSRVGFEKVESLKRYG